MKLKGIKIVGIRHEDGSGAGFRIHGYCDADLNLRDYKYSATWQHYKFRASYDTKHRTGEFTFIL